MARIPPLDIWNLQAKGPDEVPGIAPATKACRECGETKPLTDFKFVPTAEGRSHTCQACLSRRKSKGDRRKDDPDVVIFEELWDQYDMAINTSEKIRCLEALVKLRPGKDANDSKLSDPAVVAGLIRAMKAKRENA